MTTIKTKPLVDFRFLCYLTFMMKQEIKKYLIDKSGGLRCLHLKIKKHEPLWKNICEYTGFLKDPINPQRVWHAYHSVDKDVFCQHCKTSKSLFYSFKDGYRDCCSLSCSLKFSMDDRKLKMVEKYGVENPSQIEGMQDKIKRINIAKYGVEHALQLKEFRNKTKKTNVERYGVEYAGQIESGKVKAKKTNIERYGVEHPQQNHIVRTQGENTCLKKYGSTSFFGSTVGKQFIKKSNVEKYGVENISHTHVDHLGEWVDKKLFINRCKEINSIAEVLTYFNVKHSAFIKRCNSWGIRVVDIIDKKRSSQEIEIQEFLNTMGVEHILNDRSVLHPKELDFHIPLYNLAIEFNGSYWHSDGVQENKFYHQNKVTRCLEKGLNLIHIWEYLWDDPHKKSIYLSMLTSRLNKSKRVYARKCEVQQVNSLSNFYAENHLQGKCSATHHYGLFHKGELVAAMSFGKPRFTNDYDVEMIRYCSKKGVTVVGGASKLLKRVSGKSIITYATMDYSNGGLYKKLGFDFSHMTQPSYVYYHGNKGVLSRHQCQKHRLPKLLDGFDPDKSEYENMKNHGFNRIYNGGNLVFTRNARGPEENR